MLTDNMPTTSRWNTDGKPAVILVIGVNGVGKTTSIGKLAARYVNGQKGDAVGGGYLPRGCGGPARNHRLNVPVRTSYAKRGADPAAVVFDSISAARSAAAILSVWIRQAVCAAKANLMASWRRSTALSPEELPDASRETLLVLDATTGQNAVHQAEEFNKAAELTGIILTKLDGTAKGGIVIAISAGLGVPVKLVGVGEGIDDLIDFDRAAFLEAILPPVHENTRKR